ncbi:oxidation resistance protein 1 [Globodera pallida]|nr:oxidation resistance protein 1 [Globodera pallida]
MFRIIDRRIRSASSKFERLENSAEIVLARAQQNAVRSLSLRTRSRSKKNDGGGGRGGEGTEVEGREASGEGEGEGGGGGPSRTLLGLLSPRNTPNRPKQQQEVEQNEHKPLEEDKAAEMDYVEVQNTDTLEGIAAAHDCTVGGLVKLNKLTSRMVFPGQRLLVPIPSTDGDTNNNSNVKNDKNGKMNYKFNYNNVDTIYKGPGHAVRTTSAVEKCSIQQQTNPESAQNIMSTDSLTKQIRHQSNAELGRMASELDPEDRESLQRFLKIRVKQVTESDGTILGTLLVTPNCLMFDPDPDHPLVCENGSDIYGMVANMEDIVSVTVYQNISSLTGEQPNKAKDIFDPKNVMGATQKESAMDGANTNDQITGNSEKKASGEKRLHSDAKLVPKSSCCREGQLIGMDEGHPLVYGTSAGGLLLGHLPDERKANVLGSVSAGSSPSNSEQQLPCIDEESENQRAKRIELTRENAGNGGIVENRRTVSDMYCHQKSTTLEGIGDSKDSSSSSPLLQSDQFKWLKNITQQSNSLDMQPLAETEECKRAHSSFDQALSLEMGKHRLKSGEQNNQQRRSPSPSSPFSRYSPGMARKSFDKLGRTLSAKATSFKGTVQSGAQSVAHEVVTHTLSAADHIQSGIQNGAKMVASVPGSIMNVSTELLQEGQNGVKEVVDQLKALGESGEQSDRSPLAIKREKSLATLETLCQRTQQAREESVQRAHDTGFVLGAEETPVVLSDCGKKDESRPIGTPPEPPFYMVVRVDRRKKQKQRSVLLQKTNSAAEIVPPTDSNPVTSLSSTSAADLLQEEASAFGNKRKREFWFAIPRSRVDAIYHFLLQWSPQKYGKEEASTAEETNELDESEKLEESSKMSQLARVGTSAKKHLGGFVVLEGDVDDSLTGAATQLNRFEGKDGGGRELTCILDGKIGVEIERNDAGYSPSFDNRKSCKIRSSHQQSISHFGQPICHTIKDESNLRSRAIPSEKPIITKLHKFTRRMTTPKHMIEGHQHMDFDYNKKYATSAEEEAFQVRQDRGDKQITLDGASFSSASEPDRRNNGVREGSSADHHPSAATDKTTMRKPNSIQQQRTVDIADGSADKAQFKQRERLRRKSTSSRNKMSLSYRYTAPFSTSNGCGFVVPPVFPKTCSLYDEKFNGGVFADHQEDRILVEAVDRVRKRPSIDEKINGEKSKDLQRQHTSDVSRVVDDFTNYTSDSGNSSIADGRLSPTSSTEYTANLNLRKTTAAAAAKLNISSSNSAVVDDIGRETTIHQCNDLSRKNSRLLALVHRSKSNPFKKKTDVSLEKENSENSDHEKGNLSGIHCAIGAAKGISWRARLLRTLFKNPLSFHPFPDNSFCWRAMATAAAINEQLPLDNKTANLEYLTPTFGNPIKKFSKRGGNLFFSRGCFPSQFSSVSSIFSTTSNESAEGTSAFGTTGTNNITTSMREFGDSQVRRISVPLQRAKDSAAARRLSHFMQREKHANHFANLNREWEVVTVRELCRRLSLDDSLEPSEMPLPEGALHSQMLDEFMIRQIIDILPPRAEGYPWVQIYNSEKHGFSLTTLYRKMVEWDEEMSPVLLVVRDVNGHVFGAVSSGVLKPCDHYYGTGDSCLLFRFTGEYPHTRELRTFTWTGENQFFVNATRESLSFGAGGGHFGLWLDADLNHGRSQKCATFDNEPLAGGQEEDFVVQFVEVFGFCMS